MPFSVIYNIMIAGGYAVTLLLDTVHIMVQGFICFLSNFVLMLSNLPTKLCKCAYSLYSFFSSIQFGWEPLL